MYWAFWMSIFVWSGLIFPLNLKRMSQDKVVSATRLNTIFLCNDSSFLKNIHNQCLKNDYKNCVSSLLFWIFIIKWWAMFTLMSFRTLGYDWVIKMTQIFSFLPRIKRFVTLIGLLVSFCNYVTKNYQYFSF